MICFQFLEQEKRRYFSLNGFSQTLAFEKQNERSDELSEDFSESSSKTDHTTRNSWHEVSLFKDRYTTFIAGQAFDMFREGVQIVGTSKQPLLKFFTHSLVESQVEMVYKKG